MNYWNLLISILPSMNYSDIPIKSDVIHSFHICYDLFMLVARMEQSSAYDTNVTPSRG